jgi:hypothetical protein
MRTMNTCKRIVSAKSVMKPEITAVQRIFTGISPLPMLNAYPTDLYLWTLLEPASPSRRDRSFRLSSGCIIAQKKA